MPRFLLAFIIALTSAKFASSETSATPDQSLRDDPFVAQVMANPLFKAHFEGLLACAGAENPVLKLECYDGVAAAVERLADSQGWDIPELKAALSTGDTSAPGTKEDDTDAPLPEKPETKWSVSTKTSVIDDSTNVYLRLESDDHISARFGNSGPMRLFIQCRENTTLLYIHFNGHFMSDYQHGTITYRLDSEKAAQKRMRESNDHEALGLWSGGQSIPFIKSMFGHDKLLIRATPHSESALTATFTISGLEDQIAPLRKACHW